MSIPDMKWYIFHKIEKVPLCDSLNQAFYFDTKQDAENFLISLNEEKDIIENAIIRKCIFYYDNGIVNATGKTIQDFKKI